MESSAPRHPLDAPLPAEVVVGGMGRWLGYRRYPVFGGAWLRGRALVFAGPIGLMALAAGVGNSALSGKPAHGVEVGVLLFLSFMTMGFAGPLLAGWVRRRGWPERRERIGVVLAVLLGMGLAWIVDREVSTRLEETAPVKAVRTTGDAPPLPRPPAPGESRREVVLAVQPGAGVVLVNALARLTIYFLLGGGLALVGYFSEGRRREQARQQQALAAERSARQASELKLGVLQAQVEPHFLFNTLAAVRSVIREDPARAEATLDALVDYLRAAIPRLRRGGDVLEATLGRQLELCRAYLAVMQLRMGERLAVEVQVDAALAGLPFPPLTLISLVENAIKHGLEPKRGAGRLTISARRDGAQLEVEVRDDGVGLGELPGSGVGLANIREQLALRYGGRGSLEVRNAPDGGVLARLSVPLEAAP
jgi:signal transduction histidine kinase